MGAPRQTSAPEKEIRFTRARQSLLFFGLAMFFVCLSIALFLLSTSGWSRQDPVLDTYLWGFLPIPFALGLFWVAAHLARHAYIILTPLGIELFPFWFPSKNMQVLYWSEIGDLEIDLREHLIITLSSAVDSKIFVSLSPISPKTLPLLERAVEGIMENRAKGVPDVTP